MSTNVKEYVDSLWWLFVLQGIATLVFGVVALFFPGLTLASLLTVFAVYAVVAGVVELVHGFRDIGRTGSWWFSLLVGLVLVAVGVYLVSHPLTTLDVFLIILGALLLGRGIADLFVAVFYTDHDDHRWMWAISGVLGVIAGILLWRSPVSGGLAFVWVLGLYALMAGSVTLAYAFRIRDIVTK
jgi:uncharacterized membrane protein HdeD (DUF308 family)